MPMPERTPIPCLGFAALLFLVAPGGILAAQVPLGLPLLAPPPSVPIASVLETHAAAAAPHGAERYGSCGNVATVARDIYNTFGTELKALGRAVTSLLTGGGLVVTSPCMAKADKVYEATRSMIRKWNEQVAKNSWATIGPRRWHVEPEAEALSHSGTIQAWGTRIFVHQQPFVGDKVRVSIRKVEGQNPTEVTVCKTDLRGQSFRIWEFRIDGNDPDGKLYTKEFTGVKGWVLSTQLAGKNAVRKLEYRVRGTRY